jgi:hypothetical protein
MSKTCECGHHAQAHVAYEGLCGSPEGCDCNRFEPSKPVSSPKRFAEMTDWELRAWVSSHKSGWNHIALAALRDAILAERASEVIGMRDTIDALRTRAERAEQLVREIEVDAQEVRMALRTAEQERDALKDEVAGFEAMWEAREKAHDAALGEAKREGAREALTAYADKAHIWNDQRIALGVESFRDAEYPATPSGEGRNIEGCEACGYEEGHAYWCKSATPQPEPDGEIRLDVYDDDGYVRYEHVRITAPLARRLLALAQTTPEGSQYATTAELYNDLANELDETRLPEDIARLTAAIHALDPKNPPPIPTTPPRSPATVTEDELRLISDAEVVAELIERGVQPSHDTIRDIAYLLRALTAALGGRDAE